MDRKDGSLLENNLAKYYEDIVKLALAISVIRMKPSYLSGKMYAQILQKKLEGNEEHWKSKIQTLEDELLSTREELVKAKLSVDVATEMKESLNINQREQEDTSASAIVTMDYNTPPCSIESKFEEKERGYNNKHVQFLKSILSLWNTPDSAAMLNDVTLRHHLRRAILKAISVVRENIDERVFAETSIPEFCVDNLIGLLNMEENDDTYEITEGVFSFAREIMSAIMNHDVRKHKMVVEKYPKLILRLASHKKMIILILTELAEKLASFSNNLRSISQDPMLMHDFIDEYQSVYYVLWCIEKILTDTDEREILEPLCVSLVSTMEESVLHLSKSFPLFTSYVWRIVGIISTKINMK